MKVFGMRAVEVEMKSFDGDQKSSDAEAGDKAAGSAVVELDGTKKPSPSAKWVVFNGCKTY